MSRGSPLLLWFVEQDRAIKARRIDDKQMKLTFAHTRLAVRVKIWALGLDMTDPYDFESLQSFYPQLKLTLNRCGLSSGLDQSSRNYIRVSVMCTLTIII